MFLAILDSTVTAGQPKKRGYFIVLFRFKNVFKGPKAGWMQFHSRFVVVVEPDDRSKVGVQRSNVVCLLLQIALSTSQFLTLEFSEISSHRFDSSEMTSQQSAANHPKTKTFSECLITLKRLYHYRRYTPPHASGRLVACGCDMWPHTSLRVACAAPHATEGQG